RDRAARRSRRGRHLRAPRRPRDAQARRPRLFGARRLRPAEPRRGAALRRCRLLPDPVAPALRGAEPRPGAAAAAGVAALARRHGLLLMEVRRLTAADTASVAAFVADRWGAEIIVSRGRVHRPAELPGFAAADDARMVGLATYRVQGDECELVTLDSVEEGAGIGTALVGAVA